MNETTAPKRIKIAWLAIRELGLSRVLQYAVYRLGLLTGHYRRLTPKIDLQRLTNSIDPSSAEKQWQSGFPLAVPSADALRALMNPDEQQRTLRQADEICSGSFRAFGCTPARLRFTPWKPLHHWSQTPLAADPGIDIKDVWEPARFGWVYPLARAYALSGDEKFSSAFWEHAEAFFSANPPNLGPNWTSAQEVAIRTMALVFAGQVFISSPVTTPERNRLLVAQIACHADRIIPTLIYARAQDNNHLISEAVGLASAAAVLKNHHRSGLWASLSWHWFNHAIRNHINEDGEYIQHSTNYHRMVLHHALWMERLARHSGSRLPEDVRIRLAAATRWLLERLDTASGEVPNLGHNDGSNILPLSPLPIRDYRPVVQAAAIAFMDKTCLPNGAWDELTHWLGLQTHNEALSLPEITSRAPHRLESRSGWVTLRATSIHGRAAHADPLHLDIWHEGVNVALDAGTFRYNAALPWENGLASIAVHNTVQFEGQEPMLRAGRFLWLKAPHAYLEPSTESDDTLTAWHDGYFSLGVRHQRSVERCGDQNWKVTDRLLSVSTTGYAQCARLHWLLPDWNWQLAGTILKLDAPFGNLKLIISPPPGLSFQPALVRAGETLAGEPPPAAPILGWFSPTYAVKLPALSLLLTLKGVLPHTITTLWDFSD